MLENGMLLTKRWIARVTGYVAVATADACQRTCAKRQGYQGGTAVKAA